MNARRFTGLLGAGLALFAAAGASNCADQREPECQVAAGGVYAVRFTQQSETGDCAFDPETDPLASFKAPLKGGEVGMRPFVVLGSDGYADYDVPVKVAAQFLPMGELRDDAAGRLPASAFDPERGIYAFGQFTTPTPQGDICTVPSFEPGVLSIPEIPVRPEDLGDPDDEEDDDPGDPGQPAIEARAEWSNVRVLVSAAYPGAQFAGTFTYTFNGCTRVYEALGVLGTNNTHCEGSDPPEEEGGDPTPNGQPDQALCDPNPTAANQFVGTGINPDFPVTCDPDTLLCLLPAGTFPNVRK